MAVKGDTVLLADIGGTNERFALSSDGKLHDVQVQRSGQHGTVYDAIQAYLAAVTADRAPTVAAFAVAAPVTGDEIKLTNNSAWKFSKRELENALRLKRLDVINDFAAIAFAIPHLTEHDVRQVGGGNADPEKPIGVIGPGTGLGVAGLVPTPEGSWSVVAGEGGHVTMSAANSREAEIVLGLRRRFWREWRGHVSAERVISGPGLINLYEEIGKLRGQGDPMWLEPENIVERALYGKCNICIEAVEIFCGMLGTISGNLALTLGAQGGVFVAGGVVPKMAAIFDSSTFRTRFEDKGRLRAFLAPIPTAVITHELPAFVGLQAFTQERAMKSG